jgi:hypothetical protein
MLSLYEGAMTPEALGPALPADDALFGGLHCQSDVSSLEASGPWRFQHWTRQR